MLTSVVTFYDNETGPSSTASLLYQPPSSAVSNRKCRCVQHRHPERPTGVEGSVSSLCSTPPTLSPSNRKSGIRNPINRRIFNRFHFSNRKYSAISCLEARGVRPTFQSNATQPDSNRDTAIKNPDNPPHFNRFQFSNRKYSAISCLEARGFRPTFQSNATQPDSNRDTAIKNPDNPPHFNHFQFSNRDRMGFCAPIISAGSPLSVPPYLPIAHHSSLIRCHSACLRVSVPPWPIFAIMAGSN